MDECVGIEQSNKIDMLQQYDNDSKNEDQIASKQ